MSLKDWIEYNHCLISNRSPHLQPPKEIPSYWYMIKKRILMARWSDDWNCGYETEWWYCIKSDQFDIDSLKAKRRYEINKGIRNFDVKIINPINYIQDIYNVFLSAYLEYPSIYRPNISIEQIRKDCFYWSKNNIVIGCFNDQKKIVGCSILTKHFDYMSFNVLRVDPRYQKLGINFAIVFFICRHFINDENVYYISDGERNIRHITAFQDFLIKYFQFKKIYCRLNIKYNPFVKILINILFPFRKCILKKNRHNKFIYNISCLLNQESIRRSFYR